MSYPTYDMNFADFQGRNWQRAMTAEKFAKCRDWTLNDWAVALTGEVGEFCNLSKKVSRGDLTLDEARADLGKELADVLTYADLLMSKLGLNTDEQLSAKFEEVSERIGYRAERVATPTPGDAK